MNRSRLNTAIANINKLETAELIALLESNSTLSLKPLQAFFSQDKRLFGYVLHRIPNAERMLKSLGGVKGIAYTVSMMDYKKFSSSLSSIRRQRIDATRTPILRKF